MTGFMNADRILDCVFKRKDKLKRVVSFAGKKVCGK